MSEIKTKEPLVRIIKRDKSSFGYKVWVRAAAILLALVVDAIFIYSVTGLNPLSVYVVMFNGTFMTSVRQNPTSAWILTFPLTKQKGSLFTAPLLDFM